MKYQLTWHGPVHDVEYEVIADTEEDAMVTLSLYVQGERVSGVRKILPISTSQLRKPQSSRPASSIPRILNRKSIHKSALTSRSGLVAEIRWDEKAGLQRDAVRSQVIDALEAQEVKETGNEED
jgi:hypothetical protein